MGVPRIMVGGESVSSTSPSRSAGRYGRSDAWDLLGLLGFALFVVGLTDFLLTWFPERFGNPEWEFATVTAALNGIPVPLFGLTFLLVGALLSESVVWARVFSALLIVWAVGLLVMAVFYGLTLPLAAKGFAVPDVGVGLKKAIAKSLIQLLVYPLMMTWIGIRGLRSARSLTS